ncbi:MAG: cadherin domain-containing protein [Candidatus Sedimenticola sp. (ex Thyasira tokunagai)]
MAEDSQDEQKTRAQREKATEELFGRDGVQSHRDQGEDELLGRDHLELAQNDVAMPVVPHKRGAGAEQEAKDEATHSFREGTTTVTLDATGQITEAGGTVIYTALVDNAPKTDVTVTLDSGETITIEAGEIKGSVAVIVTTVEDALADSTSLSASITEINGGNFENVIIDNTPAVTDIVESLGDATVSLGATGQITEAGGTVTYTASVDNAPATDVTVTLDNGETITIEAGETTGSVDVTVAADEDALADAGSMSASISSASGGGYENLAVDATAAVTDVVDTLDTTTVSLDATGQITEAGGTVTYTATVDNAPATDITVTLDNGETITIEAGETSGSVDVVVAADEDALADATSMSASISSASGGGFENLAVDATAAVTDVVDTLDTTTVSLDATGQITEAGGTVTYTASVDNAPATDATVTLDNGETITIAAGETSGSVDVTVSADEDALADATSMSASISSASGGGFENLAVDDTAAVTEILDVNEAPTDISFSATDVNENADVGTVVATLSTTDADSGDTFTYSLSDDSDNFAIVGNQVVVKEGADLDFESAKSHTVTVEVTDSAGNSYSEDVTFSVNDLDEVASTPTLSVSLGEPTETTVGGETDYAIQLNSEGNDDALQIQNGGELLHGNDELTITMDVKFDGELEDTTPLISYATDQNNNEFRIELKPRGDNKFEIHVDSGGDDEKSSKLDNDLLFDGEMHQISISIDADGDISYNIDGNEVATDHFERSSHDVRDDGGVLIIGQEQDRVGARFDNDEVFQGQIGDIKIYDTAEVTDESEPIGHWDMNQLDSATGTVPDQAGNHDISVISIDERGFTEGSEPTLVAIGESEGSGESTLTYSLDINAALSDTDGSESLAITVSGIPEEATLSAGTDNGDGSWSLTTDQLDGLTISVPSEGAEDFSLSVTATSTESEGGAQASVSQSVDVEVVAEPEVTGGDSAPTDIKFSDTSVEENAAGGTVVATLQSIDQDTGDTFSYELVRDASGHFEIVDDKLVVKDGADIDYESQAIHELTVKVTDSEGNAYTESVNIHVDDVHEAVSVTEEGSKKSDHIEGGKGDDVIDGMKGNDHLDGEEGDDKLEGGEGDDILYAGSGNDNLKGGEGDDTFIAGEGNDRVEGGEGSDTYTADVFDGSDYFSGGDGGGWTDVIQLNADATPGSDPDSPWTISVDGEQVEYELADHALSLNPDASGTITFADGAELEFDGVERIEW